MSTPVIMDAAAVGAAALLAAIGAWRGLWKTVTGIAAFVAAMILAGMITSALAGPLTDRAVAYVMEQAEDLIQERIQSKTQETAESLEAAIADVQSASGFDKVTETLPLSQIPSFLERIGLNGERKSALMDRIREQLDSLGQSTADSARVALEEVVRQIVGPAVRSALYGLSFVLLSFVLRLLLKNVGKALGEVPGLKTVNRAGGLVLGLAEGVVLLTVASWILRTAGFTVEAPPLSDTVVLRFLAEHSLLDLLPAAQTRV